MTRGFASDNNAGVHPKVFEAIAAVNAGHTVAYGDDPYTPRAVERFREVFGRDCETFFVFNGTGANVLGLKAITQPHHSILCTEMAHIYVDECGAPERFTGSKLIPIGAPDGKLRPDAIRKHLVGVGDQHHAQPKVISITQATELGTVYTLSEIAELAKLANENGMFLHMDGTRLANAAATLGVGLTELTAGVDVLSFGGTKNGLLLGDAVVFLNRSLAGDFKYIRKQGMQLASKMRFISAQFLALFEDGLWLKNATHANRMAKLLEEQVRKIPGVRITQKVEANAIFAVLPEAIIPALQKKKFFYVFNEQTHEVRWMTSFDTTEEDVSQFAAEIRSATAAK
jgi:threonine aldolase